MPLTRSFQTICFIIGALLFATAYSVPMDRSRGSVSYPRPPHMPKPHKPRISDTWQAPKGIC